MKSSCLDFIRSSKPQSSAGLGRRREIGLCSPLATRAWGQREFASSACPEQAAEIQGSFIQTIRNGRIWNRMGESGLGCLLNTSVCLWCGRVARARHWSHQAEAAEDSCTAPRDKQAELPGNPAHPRLRKQQDLHYFNPGKELTSFPPTELPFCRFLCTALRCSHAPLRSKNVIFNQITLDCPEKGVKNLYPCCKILGKIKEVSPFLPCSVYGTISIQYNPISIKTPLI